MDKKEAVALYFDFAKRIAQDSVAQRAKVGAVIASADFDNVLSFGFNRMPSGYPPTCEFKNERNELVTRPELVHAETWAIATAVKLGIALKGSILFCTHSPCNECAKLIACSGIKSIYYLEDYHGTDAKLCHHLGLNLYKIKV